MDLWLLYILPLIHVPPSLGFSTPSSHIYTNHFPFIYCFYLLSDFPHYSIRYNQRRKDFGFCCIYISYKNGSNTVGTNSFHGRKCGIVILFEINRHFQLFKEVNHLFTSHLICIGIILPLETGRMSQKNKWVLSILWSLLN